LNYFRKVFDCENRLELKQELGTLYDEARAIIELCDTEKRTITTDEETRYEGILAEMDAIKVDIARREKLDGYTEAGAAPVTQRNGQFQNGRGSGEGYTKTPDTEQGIFARYLRTGDEGAAEEMRAYNNTDANIGTQADGGYTVPTPVLNNIVARRDEMDIIPRLGMVKIPGKGTTVNVPLDGEADLLFSSVSEAGSLNQDWPALGTKAFTLAKYGKYITLSWELLRDEDAALLSFVENWIARGWAATHNSLIVTEVLANGTAGLTLASATAIGASEVPTLVGKVLPEYQEGSQWLMHPTTWSYITGLASSSVFTFAPHPGANVSGKTLWGYNANPTSYMTAYAASVKSLVFGNFNYMGYREGTSMTALRDPFTAAATGQVKVWYWFDFVCGVLQAEALQYATHPSA
jgi:HK97 family phage major capsid protein